MTEGGEDGREQIDELISHPSQLNHKTKSLCCKIHKSSTFSLRRENIAFYSERMINRRLLLLLIYSRWNLLPLLQVGRTCSNKTRVWFAALCLCTLTQRRRLFSHRIIEGRGHCADLFLTGLDRSP